jgi:hypothetical protein
VNRERRQGQDRRSNENRASEHDRRAVADRRVALDRARDEAQIRRIESRWRALENDHPQWSHAFQRHVDVSDQQLARRAATGELPDGSQARVPAHATRWQSADAMVVAAHGLANSDEFRRARADAEASGAPRFTVTRPLREVLGPAWRADVYGRTAASHGAQASRWRDSSVAVCHWQRRSDGRWHPVSCYPEPLRSRQRLGGIVARADSRE